MGLLDLFKFFDDAFSFIDQAFLPSIFCVAIAVAALMNKDDNNTLLLIGVILVLKLFGSLYLDNFLLKNENISHIMFYFYHSLVEVIYIMVVFFRVKIILFLCEVIRYFIDIISSIFFIEKHKNITVSLNYRRHIEEYKIIFIFILNIIVNLLMIIEYAVRYSGYEEALYVYYLYTPLKVILSIYGVVLLFKIGYQAKKVFVKE